MARSKPKRRPRCGQCRAPMAHLDGFAAWVDGKKVCLNCAFKLINRK